MNTILFAAEDETSYSSLLPVAKALSEDVEVSFLRLDSMFESSRLDINLDPSPDFTHYDVQEYIQTDLNLFDQTFNARHAPIRAAVQKVFLDNLDSGRIYDIESLFEDSGADVFVSAVDQFPFIRSAIARAGSHDVRTVTIQHGAYYFPLQPSNFEARRGFPSFQYRSPTLERLKRRMLWRFGSEFCHPRTDHLLTAGTYYTERIQQLRRSYDELSKEDFTSTEVTTVGLCEYDDAVATYEGKNVKTVLFLSQQQYENGEWSWEQQQQLATFLGGLDDYFEVTVRPHPKDPERKRELFDREVTVSSDATLAEDVERHDLIVTVNSTALYEGVLQGKPVGILQLPWYEVEFEPFIHEHVIQIRPEDINTPERIQSAAQDRSDITQNAYLTRFCYRPNARAGEDATCEAIRNHLLSISNVGH